MLRRIILPAFLAVPLWVLAMIVILRDMPPEPADIDVSSWVIGMLFNVMGILLVCIPSARPVGALSVELPLKLMAFVVIGATGGFAIVAILGLSASLFNYHDPFNLRAGLVGVLGLLPGAITAAVWFVINRDIFRVTKDISGA